MWEAWWAFTSMFRRLAPEPSSRSSSSSSSSSKVLSLPRLGADNGPGCWSLAEPSLLVRLPPQGVVLWPWTPPGIWLRSGQHGLVSRLPASSTFSHSPPHSLHLRLCKGWSFCLETLPGLCPKDTHLSSKPHFSSQALKEWSPFSSSPCLLATLF